MVVRMANASETTARLGTKELLAALKAAAEPTRLRILSLLANSELNVTDLTRILGQSQPRISRHLKLLSEAGLIQRFREGSWVYFSLADHPAMGDLVAGLLGRLDHGDGVLVRDRTRSEQVRAERESAAQAYFDAHAAEWDRIRALHVSEAEVEAAIGRALGRGRFDMLVDLGTGTGRMLELLAGRYSRGLGIDTSSAMLAYARARLSRAGLAHAHVRHGDLYDLMMPPGSAEAVIMHQVLHFLGDPARAVREAARLLAPGGRLLIVDFAPHELEFLRTEFAHQRLGFAREHVRQWIAEAGLNPGRAESLSPEGARARSKLTVTLWLAHKSHSTSHPAGAGTNLEEIVP